MQPVNRACTLAALVAICATLPGAASAGQRAPEQPARFAVEPAPPMIAAPSARSVKKDPFKRLFATAKLVPPQRSLSIAAPSVRCGAALTPGDAAVNPGIRAEAGKTGTTFTIRGLQPSLCRPR